MTVRPPLHPAVFLDRDGTINVEKDYLHRAEDFEFIPGVPEAIRRLKAAGFLVVVATNQSGVARGYYDEQAVAELHAHIQERLAWEGTRIDAFYFCPHHPDEGLDRYRVGCDCRKGSPGMLLQAARDHGIDLAHSFMVGDKVADIQAGISAGCHAILVRTGYGVEDEPRVTASYPDVRVVKDLAAAVEYILSED